jgi:TetR/AcrR family transcriptional regulator, regulator of autoinduction and epiphytic fitness
MIALLEDGDTSPTARRIAARAGVSLRVVFHHFDDVESLLQAAVAVQVERRWSRVEPIRQTLKLHDRIHQLVRVRAELYESVAKVRRVALALELSSPVIAQELQRSREVLRDQLRQTFAREIASSSPARRRRLLDALEAATSFEAWDGMRRAGHTASQCRRAVGTLLCSLLAGQLSSGAGS